MKRTFYLLLIVAISGCATVQSVVKSTFPYTTTLVIPSTSPIGTEYSALSIAKSFDQKFSKDGNNANHISNVHMVSAKLEATNPGDYNIGNIQSIKLYMSKEKGEGEVLVAERTDVGQNVGNSLVLDINNTAVLDELVREPKVRVRMEYKLRGKYLLDVSLHVSLSVKGQASGG